MASSPVEADLPVNQSLREKVLDAIAKVAAVQQQDSELSGDEDLPPSSHPLHRHLSTASQQASKARELPHQQKERCAGEVQRLEEELLLLEDELQRRTTPTQPITDDQLETAIFSLAQQTQGDHSGASKQQLYVEQEDKTIKNLNSEIKLNEAFSGIKFESVEWEVVNKRGAVLHRKHTHSGLAQGFEFHVQFIVREECGVPGGCEAAAAEEEAEEARVILLHAQVDDRIQKDLQTFLARVSRDCDVVTFYQTFVKYTLLVQERKEVFRKAKSLHKAFVDLSEGSCGTRLNFTIPKGPSLHFTWTVDVSYLGNLDHALSLQIKDGHRASEDDRTSIAHLPQLLQRMAEMHGHGQALLKLLALLSSCVRVTV